jgi:Tfp pilus assembly protein PilP
MAYRAKRPSPKLTLKDFARQVATNFKKSSPLERTVIILLVVLVLQIFYHLVFVPGEQSLETAMTELRTEISAENLAIKTNARNKTETPEERSKNIENQLAKIDAENPDYNYDPKGRRDPFLPFDFAPNPDNLAAKTPLERYDLGQLKLTAILAGMEQPKAIVENAAGKGFTVTIGTKLGRNGGVIVSIDNEKIVVREKRFDFTGTEQSKDLELRIRSISSNPE